jgi:hypothetical protein
MALWAIAAGTYGTVLAVAALCLPVARRSVAFAACAAYALVAFGAGTLVSSFEVQFLVPGVLLITGYWLSGFFFRHPQVWLESALTDSDRRVFHALGIDRGLRRAPRWVLELLEATYGAESLVIAAAAIFAATAGLEAISYFWSVVITSELACYMMLPWLRSRPPRTIETPGVLAERALLLRRVNEAVLDRASVQANTLPSGHVAGAVATALGVWPASPVAGAILLAVAAVIALAAVAGRYHYVVDCLTGAAVAAIVAAAVASLT